NDHSTARHPAFSGAVTSSIGSLPAGHSLRAKLIFAHSVERNCMAKCDYCGCTIFMGGVRAGQQRFCNKKCASEAYILAASRNISQDSIDRKVEEVWRGNCPKCNGPGPVDVYKSHQVWSAVVLTRWTSNSQVSCRSCGTKRQAGA